METQLQFFRFVEATLPNGDPVRISLYKKFREDGTLCGMHGETDDGKKVYHGSDGGYSIPGPGGTKLKLAISQDDLREMAL